MKLKVYQPPGDCLAPWIVSRATGIFMMSGGNSQGSGSVDPGDEGFLILIGAAVTISVALVMFRATRFGTVHHSPSRVEHSNYPGPCIVTER